MQKILLWITPNFSRSSLFLLGAIFVSLCLTDQSLGELFIPTAGQTWGTTIGIFTLVLGIPVFYSLFVSLYKGNVPTNGQNFLIVISASIYFVIGNMAAWNNFINNATHPNTFSEQLKDFFLLIYAAQSYTLLILFILILVIRYQNKKLDLSQVFDNSPVGVWLLAQIIIACLLPYIGLRYLHFTWIENLAFCIFVAVNISKIHSKKLQPITVPLKGSSPY
jgi:hypothetical protein